MEQELWHFSKDHECRWDMLVLCGLVGPKGHFQQSMTPANCALSDTPSKVRHFSLSSRHTVLVHEHFLYTFEVLLMLS